MSLAALGRAKNMVGANICFWKKDEKGGWLGMSGGNLGQKLPCLNYVCDIVASDNVASVN